MYRLVRTMGNERDTLNTDDQLQRIRRHMLRTARGVASWVRSHMGVGATLGIQPDKVTLSYPGGTIVFSVEE